MSLPLRAAAGTVSASTQLSRRADQTVATEATMSGRCGCGHEVPSERGLFGCFDCGTTCCRACTIHLESATYCRACAGSLLETSAVHATEPFELQ